MTASWLGNARPVRLTTFSPDGTGRSSPVRAVRDGEELLVLARADDDPVRDLRRDPRVELRPEAGSGPEGVVVRGAAQVVDDPGPAWRALAAAHPLGRRAGRALGRLRDPWPGEQVTLRIRTGL